MEGDAASGIAFVQRYAGGDCREVSFAASLLRRAVSRCHLGGISDVGGWPHRCRIALALGVISAVSR